MPRIVAGPIVVIMAFQFVVAEIIIIIIIIIIYYLLGTNIYMNIFRCTLQVTLKQRSKLRPFWLPWREKKFLATKIFTTVANWRLTDYKRNLLGKLIDVWSNYQK